MQYEATISRSRSRVSRIESASTQDGGVGYGQLGMRLVLLSGQAPAGVCVSRRGRLMGNGAARCRPAVFSGLVEGDQLSGRAPVQGGGDMVGDVVRGGADRRVREVRVAGRGLRPGVSEQGADDLERGSQAGGG